MRVRKARDNERCEHGEGEDRCPEPAVIAIECVMMVGWRYCARHASALVVDIAAAIRTHERD